MGASCSNVDVRKFLPHRNPMLMVDDYFVVDDLIIGTHLLIKEENIFVENKMLSEAGLIENIAQTCSINVGQTFFEPEDTENDSKVIGFISSIKYIHIYQMPDVLKTITSIATLISRYDGDNYCICTMQGQVTCDTVKILDCELKLFIQKK